MTKVDFTYDRIRVWIVAVFNPDTQNNLLIKQELFLFSAVGLSGARAGGGRVGREGGKLKPLTTSLNDPTLRPANLDKPLCPKRGWLTFNQISSG